MFEEEEDEVAYEINHGYETDEDDEPVKKISTPRVSYSSDESNIAKEPARKSNVVRRKY